MALTVRGAIMAVGDISVDLDYTPLVFDDLTVMVDGKLRPRNLYLLVLDADDAMVYPPFILRRVEGGKEGLKIGGPGVLWEWGNNGIGPTITYAEWLSGANKLSNPGFLLDPPDVLWRTPSEDSAWIIASGVAACVGGRDGDDILEPDERWGTRPGLEYVAEAFGLTGSGRTRVRTLYEGRFNPPNLFPPLVTGGAWGAQITNNPMAAENAFEVIADSPTAIGRSDLALRAKTPFPIYQLVQNPLFDQGADGEDYWLTGGDVLWVADGSGAPDLPTSIHYEGSGFITPDTVITNGSDVLTSATADWTSPSAAGMLVEGPDIPPFTYVVSVSGPGTLQISALATADHLAGDQSVAFRPQAVSHTHFSTDAADDGSQMQYPVTKGETWDLYCHVMKTDNANGSATISFIKEKTATDDHLAGLFLEQAASITTGGSLVLSTAPEAHVRVITKQTTIEDETTGLGVEGELEGNTDGRWWFTNFLLQRVIGNADSILGQVVNVTGERTYRFTLPVKGSDLLVDEAFAQLNVFLSGPGREDVIVRSPQQHQTKGEVVDLVFDVKVPSGYTTATTRLQIQDVFNDYFYFGEMTVRDTDTSTMVFDSAVGASTVTSFAPEGAESVRVQLVVEQGATASVTGLSLIRYTATPATGDDIVPALLLNPSTGLPMSIEAGAISCPETIPYDWEQILLTNRAALDHYCSVVSIPTREYRLTASLQPLLDVAEASVLWPDPGLASAYLADDLKVLELSPPSTDVTDRPTEIRLIGNEVALLNGRTRLITATAQVPGPVEYDLQGNPIVRTLPVNDSTVDHQGYAQSRADTLAAEAADPTWAAKVVITGSADRLQAGEAVYLYDPDAGLEGPDSVEIEGEMVWPKRGRVLETQREHGPSFRVVMLAPGGTPWDLPGVLNSDSDALEITVGNRMPVEWTSDPQGGAAGKQWLEDHISRPR